jgi:hypothetical protein
MGAGERGLTEEELPEGSAPDLLAELELAADDVIHLSGFPRGITGLIRRDPPPPPGLSESSRDSGRPVR